VARRRPFSHLELTARFDKSFKALDMASQTQCIAALEQLMEDPVAPGLRLKPIQPSKKYWEARINRGDRLILYPVSGMAYVMDVVKHDDIRKWGK
jgi:hypothetical protein